MNTTLKLKPLSIRIAIIVFALFLLFSALAAFGIIDLTPQNLVVLKVAAALIIFIEIGFVSVWKTRGKSLDTLSLLGMIAGIIVLITVILGFFGISVAILNPIQGIVFGVLVISFFVEAMR